MTRIISGAAGSLRLEVPKAGTRPTSDRVREAIFSALESWGLVDGANVLDLYAGSGALGLEAASRGAAAVTLVEKHPQAAQVAERNSRIVTKAFSGGTAPVIRVEKASVQTYLDRPGTENFDVALIDPPYDLGEAELTANLKSLIPQLAEDAMVLVERSSRSPEPTWPDGLALVRKKSYGETLLWWAEIAE